MPINGNLLELKNKMELDKRVIDYKYIGTCFNTNEMIECLDSNCFFTDRFEDFSDVNKCELSTLTVIEPKKAKPYCSNGRNWSFCVPVTKVKFITTERHLRPFTADEFLEMFIPNNVVIFRPKTNHRYEYHTVFNGYEMDDNLLVAIFGNKEYQLKELFERYEYLSVDAKERSWKPFGVEE
jgi:hypothetical protein